MPAGAGAGVRPLRLKLTVAEQLPAMALPVAGSLLPVHVRLLVAAAPEKLVVVVVTAVPSQRVAPVVMARLPLA